MSRGYEIPKKPILPILYDVNKVLGPNALLGVGQQTQDPAYAELQDKFEDLKSLNDLRAKANSTKDLPTTAAGDRGQKDLPATVQKVGQNSVQLQKIYQMMNMASAIMSGMGDGAGGEKSGGTPSAGKKKIIEDALSGAMAILIKKWGYDKVIDVFDAALINDNIKLIDKEYRQIVLNAIANAYKAAVTFGPNNVPVYSYSTVTTIGPVPSPLVEVVPDMYTQEYYIQADDPYPGFIKWNSVDETEYVFTRRQIGDVYYVSPQEEIYSIAEKELSEKLDPYIENENLTAKILNELLIEQNINIEDNTNEKTLGKGTGSKGANVQQLIQQLLGFISQATNTQKSNQLPPSVLNKSSIQKSLKKFEKRQAELKKIRKHLDKGITDSLTIVNNSALLDLPSNPSVKTPTSIA